MGIKFLLRLQTLPRYCFHVTTAGEEDEIPCSRAHESPPSKLKIIKWDGTVESYDKAIKAREVMSRFPKHLVCGSDSLTLGQKIPALSESDTLQLGRKYFLLPHKFFQNNLTFISVAKLINRPSHLDVQKTPNGSLRIQILDEEEEDDEVVLCTTPQLKKEYSLLVGGAQWKPKLETIRESSKEVAGRRRRMNKRKIGYTSSFRFRTAKSSKTVSVLEQRGGPNCNFNKLVNGTVGGSVKSRKS